MESHGRGFRIRKTECNPYPELAVYRHRYLLKVQQNLRKMFHQSKIYNAWSHIGEGSGSAKLNAVLILNWQYTATGTC